MRKIIRVTIKKKVAKFAKFRLAFPPVEASTGGILLAKVVFLYIFRSIFSKKLVKFRVGTEFWKIRGQLIIIILR